MKSSNEFLYASALLSREGGAAKVLVTGSGVAKGITFVACVTLAACVTGVVGGVLAGSVFVGTVLAGGGALRRAAVVFCVTVLIVEAATLLGCAGGEAFALFRLNILPKSIENTANMSKPEFS